MFNISVTSLGSSKIELINLHIEKCENTSYSAMLNIAGISSAPESIPPIPELLESLAIPEFRTTPNDSGIAQRIRIIFKPIHNSEIIIIILIPE